MKKKSMNVASRNAWAGRSFLIPFYIGVIFFFIVPLIQSIIYSFSEISIESGGYKTKFVGLENYNYIFRVDTVFGTNLLTSMGELLYRIPIVLVTSLLLAMVIKKSFPGRTAVRAIFFLPMVLSSGVLSGRLTSDMVVSSILKGGADFTAGGETTLNFIQTMLNNAGLPEQVVTYFSEISANLFACMWLSGVQIIIFLTGLQKISPSLYESSAIEGATAWDDFWKITLPMLKPITLFVIVFTIVETFTERTNKTMAQILHALTYMRISRASAMVWAYSILALIVVCIVFLMFRERRDTYDI